MATIEQMRAGLASNLAAVGSYQISKRWLANPSPPTIDMRRSRIMFDEAQSRGLDVWTFIVRAIVADSSDLSAQTKLDSIIDKVKAAVESDRTLGGVVDSLVVMEASDEKLYVNETAGLAYLGCEFTVEIYAS